MGFKNLKFLLLIILVLFVLCGCTEGNNNNGKNKKIQTELRYLVKYGDWNITNGLGVGTTMLTFYTNNQQLEIEKFIFVINNNYVEIRKISEIKFDKGKFIYVALDQDKVYSISKIRVNTNQGEFVLDTVDINTKYTPNCSQESCEAAYINLDDAKTYPLDIFFEDNISLSFNLHIKQEKVKILNIELYEQNKYPSDLNIKNIYINGALFIPNERDYYYKAESIKIDVFLSKYLLGNYTFKITYQVNNNTYILYTSPITIDTLGDLELTKNLEPYLSLITKYIGDELSYAFTKKD